jgi:hypothetical protein
MTQSLACFAVLAAVAAAPLWAHHSFAAEYDASKLLTLTGKVVKFEWTNPHTHLRLEVKGVHWYLEMASPNGMMRQSWLANTVKPGDVVTVEAYQSKDYDTAAKTHRVKVPDGRWLSADASSLLHTE